MPSILNATTTTGLVSSADNSGSLQLQTNNGTTAVTIDTNQNVGIGTTSPNDRLDVVSSSGTYRNRMRNSGANEALLSFQNSSTGTSTTDGYLVGLGGGAEGYVWNWENQPIQFGTNGTERMRIDSSGNIIMGHTAYDYSVNGFGFGAGNAYSYFTRTSGFALGVNRKTTTGDLMAWWYNQSGVGTVSTNGSSTSYNTTSDYRLKENITPMTGALATVSQLKPVTYRWKSTGKESQGFIAHELQAVVPDCVNGEKDAVDEEGNPVYQGVDTSFLVATLTAAIQELKAQLDTVKAEVQALKGAA